MLKVTKLVHTINNRFKTYYYKIKVIFEIIKLKDINNNWCLFLHIEYLNNNNNNNNNSSGAVNESVIVVFKL